MKEADNASRLVLSGNKSQNSLNSFFPTHSFERRERLSLSSLRKENKKFYQDENKRLQEKKVKEQIELTKSREAKEQEILEAKREYEMELAGCTEYKVYEDKLNKELFYQELNARKEKLAQEKAGTEAQERANVILSSSMALSGVTKDAVKPESTSSLIDSSVLHSKGYDELRPLQFVRRELDFNKFITNGNLLLDGEKQMINQMHERIKRLDELESLLDKEEIRLENNLNMKEENIMLASIQSTAIDEIRGELLLQEQQLDENFMTLVELIKIETLQLESHLRSKDLSDEMASLGIEGLQYNEEKIAREKAWDMLANQAEEIALELADEYASPISSEKDSRLPTSQERIKSLLGENKSISKDVRTRTQLAPLHKENLPLKSIEFGDEYFVLRLQEVIDISLDVIGQDAAELLGISQNFRDQFNEMCQNAKNAVDLDLIDTMEAKTPSYKFPLFSLHSVGETTQHPPLRVAGASALAASLNPITNYNNQFESLFALFLRDNETITTLDCPTIAADISPPVREAMQALFHATRAPRIFYKDAQACVISLNQLINKQANSELNKQMADNNVERIADVLKYERDETTINEMKSQIEQFNRDIERLRTEVLDIQGIYRKIDRENYKNDLEFEGHIKLLKTCNACFNFNGMHYTLAKSEDLDSYTGPLEKYQYLKQITIDRQNEANRYIEEALQQASIMCGIMDDETKDGMVVISELEKLDRRFDVLIQQLAEFDTPTLRTARRELLRLRRKELEDLKCSMLNQHIEIDETDLTWYETLEYTKSAMERNISDTKRITTLEKSLIQYEKDIQAKYEDETFYE